MNVLFNCLIEGVRFKKELNEKDKVYIPPIFEDNTSDLKAPKIKSEDWKIGIAEVYNPPVGFARNPGKPLNR